MGYEFSDAQSKVINAKRDNILVSAAAGSGKTTVLVERIVNKLLSGEYGINEILVVTFTRDAAANMREKIEKQLRKRILELRATGEDYSNLRRQLDLLPNAYIQTLDSFCTRVIKEKGYLCEGKSSELIDSSSTILDTNALKVILLESAKSAIEYFYLQDEVSDGFIKLTNMFGDGRTDDELAQCITDVYSKLRSLPNYIDKCDEAVAKRVSKDEAGTIPGLDRIVSSVIELANSVCAVDVNSLKCYLEGFNFVKSKKDNISKIEKIGNIIDFIHDFACQIIETYRVSGDLSVVELFDDIDNSIITENICGIKLSYETNVQTEVEAFYKGFAPFASLLIFMRTIGAISFDLRSAAGYNDLVVGYKLPNSIEKFFCRGTYDYLGEQKNRTSIITAFVELIKKTDELYAINKASVHGMDFPDQSHLALDILQIDEASDYYKNKFEEIYIDEYQDNSEIQDYIIKCIERDSGNVFRVGDIKQSIYRFRYADPSMFSNKMDSYENSDEGSLYLLNGNYRSDNTILTFVNHFFENIMKRTITEIEYDDNQKLIHPEIGGHVSECSGVNVRCVNYVGSSNKKNAINEGVLAEVERFRSLGIDYKDICVLTATNKCSSMISEYLINKGHSAVYSEELSVFGDSVIRGLCNIITVVSNEYRDECLMGILISPYAYSNFTVAEVSTVISFANKNAAIKGQNLIVKIRYFVDNCDDSSLSELVTRMKFFVEWIDRLRNEQIITDVSELLDRIYDDTGIGLTTGDEGKLALFKSWMCDNFLRYGSDISTVSAELEHMEIKLGTKTSVKSADGSDKNSIKCMTYHSSKGLEFKAVIIAELDPKKGSNNEGTVLYDSHTGFVVSDYSEENIRKDKSIDQIIYDETKKMETISEQMRLMYVAQTRAAEMLSVVVAMPYKYDNKKNTYSCEDSSIKLFKSFLDRDYTKDYWLLGSSTLKTIMISGLLKMEGSDSLLDIISNWQSNYPFIKEYSDYVLTIDRVQFENADETEDDDSDSSEDESTVCGIANKEAHGKINTNFVSIDSNGMPVFAPYKYEEASKTPFKMSVSSLKNRNIRASSTIALDIKGIDYYMSRLNGNVGESASEIGTFLHKIFRFVDMGRIRDDSTNYENEIDCLIQDGIISPIDRDKALSFKSGVIAFANSEVGSRMISSELLAQVQYEKPIEFSIASDFDSVHSDDILVQGVIDVLFRDTDGEYVLIDYKTDSLKECINSSERSEEALCKHSFQINCYAEAVECSGVNVKERYIYLVKFGEFIRVTR